MSLLPPKYSWVVLVIFFVNGKIMIKVTNNQYKNGNRNENIMLFIIVSNDISYYTVTVSHRTPFKTDHDISTSYSL